MCYAVCFLNYEDLVYRIAWCKCQGRIMFILRILSCIYFTVRGGLNNLYTLERATGAAVIKEQGDLK